MLAAMAQATSRLRLGCQVTGMPYRHPAVLANIAATVDVISGEELQVLAKEVIVQPSEVIARIKKLIGD